MSGREGCMPSAGWFVLFSTTGAWFISRAAFRLGLRAMRATIRWLMVRRGSPTLVLGLFCIGGHLHAVCERPGRLLLRAETTAMLPAIIGVPAAAGVILAREWPAAVF